MAENEVAPARLWHNDPHMHAQMRHRDCNKGRQADCDLRVLTRRPLRAVKPGEDVLEVPCVRGRGFRAPERSARPFSSFSVIALGKDSLALTSCIP